MNDLRTADLAEELADALGAACIVNPTLDRNQLDLNRISQVTARAPWFLALIEALLDDILARHPRAEVLFLHGWNVIQPKCDIGVGHTFASAAAAHSSTEALTVSPEYVAARLEALRLHCARAGIAATFGERYPARHPNNLLQLFRHRTERPPAVPRLAQWAAARRVEAVQLELGVAVRWPGTYRRGFLRAAAAAFSGAAPPPRAPRAAPHPVPPLPPPASLQLYDPEAAVGLTARVDRVGPRGVTGRLLLLLGRRRQALFIGEDRGGDAVSDGPRFTAVEEGFRLRFHGPALATSDGTLYLDLEQAFAASRLCAVDVDLLFRPGLSADYGATTGWVEVDGRRSRIAAYAFARHGVAQRSHGAWSSQLALSAAFGPERALRLRHEFPGTGVLYELTARGEAARPLLPLTVRFDGDRYTPARIAVGGGALLLCAPLTRMVVTRLLGPHRQARVTFGAGRFWSGGARGFGFYEYARVLA